MFPRRVVPPDSSITRFVCLSIFVDLFVACVGAETRCVGAAIHMYICETVRASPRPCQFARLACGTLDASSLTVMGVRAKGIIASRDFLDASSPSVEDRGTDNLFVSTRSKHRLTASGHAVGVWVSSEGEGEVASLDGQSVRQPPSTVWPFELASIF